MKTQCFRKLADAKNGDGGRRLCGAAALVAAIVFTAAPGPVAAEPDTVLFTNLPALELPPNDPDLLARGHYFRLLGAGLEFVSSGVAGDDLEGDDTSNYTLSADTRYFRSLEKRQFGYSALIDASESLFREPFDRGSQYINNLYLDALPEARFYPTPNGRPFFVYGAAELDLHLFTTKTTGRFATDADSIATGRVSLAAGVGFGRVLAIDPAVRLRRLEQALQGEGLIAGPIPGDVGDDIIRSWYALRNHIGNYPRLAYTMKHLAQAGMLTEAPNLRATYKAIAILSDPFIFNRRRGYQARLGLGLVMPFIAYDAADAAENSAAVLGSAQYERPLSTTRQLSLSGQLFVDLGDTEVANREWSARAQLTHTRAFYTPTYDPTGSLTLAAEAGISGVRTIALDKPSAGIDVVGQAVYSRVLDGGSLATLGASLRLRNDGEYTVGLSVGFTRGIASGFYTPYASAAALAR